MSLALNIIEHLWPSALEKVEGHAFSSPDVLWTHLEQAFLSIDPLFIKRLYASIPDHLAAVIASKDGHTKYY